MKAKVISFVRKHISREYILWVNVYYIYMNVIEPYEIFLIWNLYRAKTRERMKERGIQWKSKRIDRNPAEWPRNFFTTTTMYVHVFVMNVYALVVPFIRNICEFVEDEVYSLSSINNIIPSYFDSSLWMHSAQKI